MASLHGASRELQALEDQVPNRTDWKYEMRREAQEILPGTPYKSPSVWTVGKQELLIE
jgi:hypothetical protein